VVAPEHADRAIKSCACRGNARANRQHRRAAPASAPPSCLPAQTRPMTSTRITVSDSGRGSNSRRCLRRWQARTLAAVNAVVSNRADARARRAASARRRHAVSRPSRFASATSSMPALGDAHRRAAARPRGARGLHARASAARSSTRLPWAHAQHPSVAPAVRTRASHRTMPARWPTACAFTLAPCTS
jgi:uncharacterized protein involved in type VI secretion and phage assembly